MLTQVTIQNFVIVDQLSAHFEAGMTVLTGETGAGKSILIDAIELALGKRASAQAVRPGAKQACITLDFDIRQEGAVQAYLREHGLDEETCLIQRTIYQEGQSKSLVNGTPVTLQMVKEIAGMLINIHGQHEFQNLLKPGEQRVLLDTYASSPLLEKISQAFSSWKTAEKIHLAFAASSKNAEEKIEILRFQIQELEKLNLQIGEWAELSERQTQMAHAEEIQTEGEVLLELLDGDQGVISHLAKSLVPLAKLKRFYPSLAATEESLNSALIQAEEAVNDIRHETTALEFDPVELQTIEARLSLAHQLSRKYHLAPEALPEKLLLCREEFANLEQGDDHLEQLKREAEELKIQYEKLATDLTQHRQKAALKFSQAIVANMTKLGMPKSRFVIEVLPGAPSHHGSDEIHFLVSTNPGQKPGTLQAVASGGELSRISLAIEVILVTQKTLPVLIFDEVDVGVDATTAKVVGEMLKTLGKSTQVFCITHQASVAAAADHHFQVKKHLAEENTRTELLELTDQARLLEIVRMMGGNLKDPMALEHAKAFLEYQTEPHGYTNILKNIK